MKINEKRYGKGGEKNETPGREVYVHIILHTLVLHYSTVFLSN